MTTVDMTNKHQREYVQVCTLKGAIKMAKVGMRHSRVSNKTLMTQAKELTGANFTMRDYDGAIKALEARRDALLVYIGNEQVDG